MDEQIKFELEQIRRDLSAVRASIEDIEQRTGKIESYLYNDEHTDTEGIVKRVRRHDQRLGKLEEVEKIKNAKLSVWGMIGGAVLIVAIEIIKWLFSSHK